MGLTDIKKELNKIDKGKLVDLIADLYKKNKSVKEYFDFYLNPNENELFRKYRNKVYEAFYPKRGFGLKLKDGKQAISEFKKLGASLILLADLMLFYVETGVEFTNDYGDIDENYYLSLERMYIQALSLMTKENLLEKFAERTKKVMIDANNIGWGFGDFIAETYCQFYPDDLEPVN
jgi:hypothetical protein